MIERLQKALAGNLAQAEQKLAQNAYKDQEELLGWDQTLSER